MLFSCCFTPQFAAASASGSASQDSYVGIDGFSGSGHAETATYIGGGNAGWASETGSADAHSASMFQLSFELTASTFVDLSGALGLSSPYAPADSYVRLAGSGLDLGFWDAHTVDMFDFSGLLGPGTYMLEASALSGTAFPGTSSAWYDFLLDFGDGLGPDTFDNDLTQGGNNAPVPEPCTLALLGMGVIGLAVRRKRQTA